MTDNFEKQNRNSNRISISSFFPISERIWDGKRETQIYRLTDWLTYWLYDWLSGTYASKECCPIYISRFNLSGYILSGYVLSVYLVRYIMPGIFCPVCMSGIFCPGTFVGYTLSDMLYQDIFCPVYFVRYILSWYILSGFILSRYHLS